MLAAKPTSVKCSTSEHFICPSLLLTHSPLTTYRLAILLFSFPFEAGARFIALEFGRGFGSG